jgi:hypothetical protein
MLLVSLPLEIPSTNRPPAKLLDRYIEALFDTLSRPSGGGLVEVHLLLWLGEWLTRCPVAVDAVFERVPFLNHLIGLANGTAPCPTTTHVRGLATWVLATCADLSAAYFDEQIAKEKEKKAIAAAAAAGLPPPASASGSEGKTAKKRELSVEPLKVLPSVLLDVITRQIGLDNFKLNLEQLRRTSEFEAAERLITLRDANPFNYLAAAAEKEKRASDDTKKGDPTPDFAPIRVRHVLPSSSCSSSLLLLVVSDVMFFFPLMIARCNSPINTVTTSIPNSIAIV